MGCKVFKVAVFFDGTGNSIADGVSKSNVAKLYESYREVTDEEIEGKKTTTRKIYKIGIGRGEGEGSRELAAGGGGAKRINEALKEVKALIKAHPYGDSEYDYKSREIEVFGFSRGAAEARDFVNTFYGEYTELKHIKFTFIGIFDTVGSFGLAGNDIDYKPKDPKKHSESGNFELSEGGFSDNVNNDFEPYNFNLSSSSAKTIIHLTAADELRHNFPLYSADGAANEMSLIGVHSDIGGGYGTKDRETLSMEVPLRELNKRYELQSKGWEYQPKRYDRITGVFEKKRVVGNDLGKVSLHLMYQLAVKYKVTLNTPSESVPNTMKAYFEYAKTHLSNASNYSDAENIKETYAHQSATHPLTNTLSYPLRQRENSAELVGSNIVNIKRYKNRRGKVERAIFPNKASRAIVPI